MWRAPESTYATDTEAIRRLEIPKYADSLKKEMLSKVSPLLAPFMTLESLAQQDNAPVLLKGEEHHRFGASIGINAVAIPASQEVPSRTFSAGQPRLLCLPLDQ